MGFGTLRVINDDWVKPGNGFETHSHQDMEIISYVMEGALEHKDNVDGGSVIRSGEVQRMSAGTGLSHSEFNPSKTDSVHFIQIWIVPNELGVNPSYEQKFFPEEEKKNRFRLIASPNGEEGSVRIRQDLKLYSSVLESNHNLEYKVYPDRQIWLQVVKGSVILNGNPLQEGDGCSALDIENLELSMSEKAEILLFDMKKQITNTN